MSAVIAGDKCKECGKKHWVSFGHPTWYDDVIKRGLPKSKTFLMFERMVKSGSCFTCYVTNTFEAYKEKKDGKHVKRRSSKTRKRYFVTRRC